MAAVQAWEFEKQGILTLSMHLLPQWYWERTGKVGNSHGAEQEGVAHMLDELHLRKIDLADEVFVMNVPLEGHPDGYIGERTRIEIDYAVQNGKPVRYYQGNRERWWRSSFRLGQMADGTSMSDHIEPECDWCGSPGHRSDKCGLAMVKGSSAQRATTGVTKTMQLETINKLYLELAQVATAKTLRELKMEQELDALRKAQPPCATCQVCNWTNAGCLNLGESGKPFWMCHGCIKAMRDRSIKFEDLLCVCGASKAE